MSFAITDEEIVAVAKGMDPDGVLQWDSQDHDAQVACSNAKAEALRVLLGFRTCMTVEEARWRAEHPPMTADIRGTDISEMPAPAPEGALTTAESSGQGAADDTDPNEVIATMPGGGPDGVNLGEGTDEPQGPAPTD